MACVEIPRLCKPAAARRLYDIDYSGFAEFGGDSPEVIVGTPVIVVTGGPGGLSPELPPAVDPSGPVVQVWIGGGSPGVHTVVSTVTTDRGSVLPVTVEIEIE
jgi:hypothetical protein